MNQSISDRLKNDSILRDFYSKCIAIQTRAVGKIKVGCVVEAVDYESEVSYTFVGANLHVSDSYGDVHAEQQAVQKAIQAKCYPETIYVTSQSFDEDVLMCGQCRQYVLEINQYCNIVVFNPDGTVKRISTVHESLPYHKNVEDKNRIWLEFCGGKR